MGTECLLGEEDVLEIAVMVTQHCENFIYLVFLSF